MMDARGDYTFETSPLCQFFQYGGKWEIDNHDFVSNRKQYFEMSVEVSGENGTNKYIINAFDIHELAYLTRNLGKIHKVKIIELLN